MTERFHLVVCIADEIYDVPGMVLRHYPVAFKHEAAWFGKPDPAIHPSHLRELNAQIEQGFPTLLAVTNHHSSKKVVYFMPLLRASSRLPKEKELIPPFYEELNMLSCIRTWLKIGYSMDGYLLNEIPDLEKAVAAYNRLERKLLKKGPVDMPGYFFFRLDKP
jgi:hypothetical protein